MPPVLRVLVLSDTAAECDMLARQLVSAGFEVALRRASTEAAYLAELASPPDLILADNALRAFDAMHALQILGMHGLDIPLIVVAEAAGEEAAIECVCHGAADFVFKDRSARLRSAAIRALDQRTLRAHARAAEAALRASEERFRTTFEASNDAIIGIALDGTVISWNTGAQHLYGYSADQMIGQPVAVLRPPHVQDKVVHIYDRLTRGGGTAHIETVRRRSDGRLIDVALTISAIQGADGGVSGFSTIARDISTRKQSDQALRQTSAFVRLLQEVAVAANQATSLDQALQTAIDKICEHIGWPVGHIYMPDPADQGALLPTNIWHLEDQQRFDTFRKITEVVRLAPGIGLPGQVMISRNSVWVTDMNLDISTPRTQLIRDIGVRASFALPVLLGDQVAAVLEFFATEAIEPDAALLDVLHHVGTQLGRVVERERAEAALRAAEAQYRTLVEQLPAIIYTAEINTHSSTTYVSPQIEMILGFSPEEWIANSNLWLEQVHPDDRPHMLEAIERAHSSDVPIPIEYRSFTRDGRMVWLRDAARVVRDKSGHALFLQGITLDITERKLAEEALIDERALLARRVDERTADLSAANADLARAAMLKDEFLASMSHELRTPLNAVLGLSEALQEEIYGSLNDRQRRALHSIAESGRHLLDLINDILDLAKIGAGKLELDLQPVAVETICQASLRLIKQVAHTKQLSVALTLDPAVTLLHVDARRMKQILVNLLSNAVKFTPAGGSIGLEVAGNTIRQAVDLTVWDTGIGIAHEQMSQLFQPFVQLDRRLARQYEGTGLGLALVYRMIELHGGSIAVTSEIGRGSRFTVALPWPAAYADAPASHGSVIEPAPHPISPPARPAPQPLVLLAEDNEATITMIVDYLDTCGYRVVVARNGAEAIMRAREARPAIVLMDIQMPGIDGLEATRRIRTIEALADLPVIALTALAMPGDHERCLAAGANHYLSKPVSLRRLANLIEHILHCIPASKGATYEPADNDSDRR
jgi:PAS domain S-box-containing protein